MNSKLLRHLVLAAVLLALAGGCSSKKGGTESDTPPLTTEEPPPPPPPPPTDESAGLDTPSDLMLQTIYFEYDKYSLKSDAKEALSKNAATLGAYPEVTVVIEGHCDERGTVEYNLALGEKRARAARDYLVDLGIGTDRIRTISYGEERPVDPGHGESSWSKNRRAEFLRTDQ